MQLHGVGAPGSVPPSGLLQTPLVPPARPAWAQLGQDPLKTLQTAWLGVGHVQETLKFIL